MSEVQRGDHPPRERTNPPRSDRSGTFDVLEILKHMKETIEESKSIPFSENCVVSRDEMLYWINQITERIPDEVMQARYMLDQNRQIVAGARQKAESILRETEQRSAIMVNEHEITLHARELAQQTIEQANQNAWRIRTASTDYVHQRLTELENQLTEMLVTVQKNKKELK